MSLILLPVYAVFSVAVEISPWTEVAPGVFRYRDACNVYCVKDGDEGLLIETGTGAVMDALPLIGVSMVSWVLHTHAHRDLAQGDNRFAATGAQIAVPEGTRLLFEQAEAGWRGRTTYYGFNYGDKHFLPLRNIPVARELKDGDVFEWKSVRLRVIATPGHTEHHLAFILDRDGQRYGFTGDVIAAPGKVWELDALQSSYEEFIQNGPALQRVPELLASLDLLRAENPTLILPAHGEPFGDCGAAMDALTANINRMMKVMNAIQYFGGDPVELPEVEMYQTGACVYLIRNPEGHGVLFDPGFVDWDNGSKNYLKWLQSMPDLKLDIVTASHYHCDHMASMAALVDHYGAQVYLHESLTPIFTEPHRFHLPCLHMHPVPVARSFKDGESFTWSGINFTFHHFPGQTQWHQAALAEINGKRILFTGDSVDDFDHIRNIDCWNYNPIGRPNGAMACVEVLEKTRPDYLATGHWGIREWKPEYIQGMRQYVLDRDAALTALIAQNDPNLGYDMNWVTADPFRAIVKEQRTVTFNANVRNHLGVKADAIVIPHAPVGWTVSSPQTLVIPPHESAACAIAVTVPQDATATRHMIGLDVTLNGQPYGEMGIAAIDVGEAWDAEQRDPSLFPGVSQKGYGYFP